MSKPSLLGPLVLFVRQLPFSNDNTTAIQAALAAASSTRTAGHRRGLATSFSAMLGRPALRVAGSRGWCPWGSESCRLNVLQIVIQLPESRSCQPQHNEQVAPNPSARRRT